MVILKIQQKSQYLVGKINKYNVYLKQWEIFCKDENIITSILLKQGLVFLTHLFKKGNKYSLISSARSVLSNVLPQYDGVEFGEHKHVKKFMKQGIFNLKPSLPKYLKI